MIIWTEITEEYSNEKRIVFMLGGARGHPSLIPEAKNYKKYRLDDVAVN